MFKLRKKSTAIVPRRDPIVKANNITPRQEASVFPKVMFVLVFGSLFFFMGREALRRASVPAAEITTAPDTTYLERVDANPMAITTPEVSDWVLGQDERVETAADLDALNVELKQIEVEQKEVENMQAALNVESEFLDENARIIRVQQSVALLNELARLGIRKGETQRKIDEAKGLAEAKSVEVQAMTNASATVEAVRIENIEIEAAAELEAAKMKAESDKAAAQAKRDLARANLYYSIAPLLSQFVLVLSCLLIVILISPAAIGQIKKAIDTAKSPAAIKPSTRQVPDQVDEFLGAAVKRASTPPVSRPKRQKNSKNASETPETGRNAQNSSQNSKNSVAFVTTNHPWTKRVFNEDQLKVISNRLGDTWTADIVDAIAHMEIDQLQKRGHKVSRRAVVEALGLNSTAYHKFFLIEVTDRKKEIVHSRGGSFTTSVLKSS